MNMFMIGKINCLSWKCAIPKNLYDICKPMYIHTYVWTYTYIILRWLLTQFLKRAVSTAYSIVSTRIIPSEKLKTFIGGFSRNKRINYWFQHRAQYRKRFFFVGNLIEILCRFAKKLYWDASLCTSWIYIFIQILLKHFTILREWN